MVSDFRRPVRGIIVAMIYLRPSVTVRRPRARRVAVILAMVICVPPAAGEGPRRSRLREFEDRWWPQATAALAKCDRQARDEHRFGDVVVSFWPTPRDAVKAKASKQLGRSFEGCVTTALRAWLRSSEARDGVAGFQAVAALGEARALFPDEPWFVTSWAQASFGVESRRPAARRGLMARLGPDIKVERDGCLSVEPTPLLGVAVDQWLSVHTKAIDRSWFQGRRLGVFGSDATSGYLLMPDGHLIVRTFIRRGPLEVDVPVGAAERLRGPSIPVDRLCLAKVDDGWSSLVAQQMEAFGTCWTPVGQALVEPRFEFPRDRRYKVVRSANEGAACALDAANTLVCCGGRVRSFRVSDVEAVEARPGVVCVVGKDKNIQCAQLSDGKPVTQLAGPFTSVSTTDSGRVCGLQSDGGFACSDGKSAAGRFREVEASGPCALADDGSISCWRDDQRRQVGPAVFRTLASEAAVGGPLCALDRDGAPWCTDRQYAGWQLARESGAKLFDTIDVDRLGRCGIPKGACDIECWREVEPRHAPSGCYRQFSLGRPSCALDAAGEVRCWGHPEWQQRHTTGGG